MIQAICWVLIHSLWQGVLLALAGGGVILCTKRSAAAVRYRLLCGLSALFLVGIGFTFFYECAMLTADGEGAGEFGVSIGWLGKWCSVHAYKVVAGWLVVAAGKSLRMAAGWSYMRRLRREGLAAPALWERKVNALSRQLGIRRTVKLVESTLVRVPVVIGQLKPIIYIPLGLVNHLPASEMEAVLLHELAHIRRYDHVVNLAQQVVECLLFFNPGFLWVSSIMREERENSCDDIAIAHTRDRVEFVRALVRFKEHSMRGMALAFPGNRRQLLHRVLRISRQENKTLSGRERLLLLGGCIVLLFLLAARMGTIKMEEKGSQGVESQGVEVKNTAVVPVKPELLSVLQARQQVVQNMEWVQAQLDRLHHKPGGKKGNGGVDHLVKGGQEMAAKVIREEMAAKVVKGEMATKVEKKEMAPKAVKLEMELDLIKQDMVKEAMVKEEQSQEQQRRNEEQDKLTQVESNQKQAVLGLEQAERDRQQALRDREQAERDRQQADQDREQANKDREQANKDREQADRNRDQAERDRQEAERNSQQAERNSLEAERTSQQAERKRQQSDDDRARAELNRRKAELDRQKTEFDRINKQ